MEKSKQLAVLILAAGTSSRLGEPKQLLMHNGTTLLHQSCLKALHVASDVYVVLGGSFEKCYAQIESLNVTVIENKQYEDGLSSSIKEGINALLHYERVLIMLCDQPFIPSSHLEKLWEESKHQNIIACSFYENQVGVPAVFPQEFYKQLLQLDANYGAKRIIKENEHICIPLQNANAIDIDKQEDKKYLNQS